MVSLCSRWTRVFTHGKRTQQQASKLLSDADTPAGATKTPGGNGVATLANGMRPVVEPPVLGSPEHTDYYMLNELLTDDQRALKARIRSFMDTEVAPIINAYWERAEFPFELVPKLATLNIAGFQIPGFGCPGMSNLTAGLAILELARSDLSLATFMGVQSALAMTSIALLGSEWT
jgi:glutaryl-CoA dehydrogenase